MNLQADCLATGWSGQDCTVPPGAGPDLAQTGSSDALVALIVAAVVLLLIGAALLYLALDRHRQ